MKRYITTIASLLSLLYCCTLPTSATAQEAGIAALAGNEEYMTLIRRNTALSKKVDSVTTLMNDMRQEFRSAHESREPLRASTRDSFSNRIIELEQLLFDLRDERGVVSNRINSIEQEWVLGQFNNDTSFEEQEQGEAPEEAQGEEQSIASTPHHRNLIDNAPFHESLTKEDYAELRRAHDNEQRMIELSTDFLGHYAELQRLSEEYAATPYEAVADSLQQRFTHVETLSDSTNRIMEECWHSILDTKYYAYGYLLEKCEDYELLDKATDRLLTSQQESAESEGYFISDALVRYAILSDVLRDYESAIAEKFGYNEAIDSIIVARREHPAPDFRLEQPVIERRLFIDYEPITFGSTSYYNNANPIPHLKVYDEGKIYRIRLGRFRTMQKLTIFKGVRPLYIGRNDEGHYLYFTGGFATLVEAEEAVDMLRSKGFRAPYIYVWEDGVEINLSEEAKEETEGEASSEPESNKRYMVDIVIDELTADMRATIEAVASGKRISRAGNKFVVGTFTEQAEAERLSDAMREMFTDIEVAISEIEINANN